MKTSAKLLIFAAAIASPVFAEQSLAATPKVIVNNGATNPVPVTVQNGVATTAADNPAFQPFAFDDTDAPAASVFGTDFIFQVPSGKRLVIETVTASASLPSGQSATAQISVVTGGNFHVHSLPIQNQGGNGSYTEFRGANQVRLYAEGGSTVLIHIQRTDNTGTWNAAASLSGYLVDVP